MNLLERRLQVEHIALAYRRLGFESYYERMQSCSSFVTWKEKIPLFVDADGDPDEGYPEFRLTSANFCRVRHCPICQWRRVVRWKARFRQFSKLAESKVERPRWVFLTLTVRNCPWEELKETVGWMNRAFYSRSFARSSLFGRSFWGWIRSLEITRGNEPKSFHPHFHCLLLTDEDYFSDSARYYSQQELVDMWAAALGVDYQPIVDVQAVDKCELGDTVPEVFKYQVKPDELWKFSDEELKWLTLGLHGVHGVNRGGLLRNCEVDEDDLIGRSVEPAIETGVKLVQEWDFGRRDYDYKLVTSRGVRKVEVVVE